MALGSTQPLTEMSTGNLPWGKWRPAHEDNLTAIYEPIVWKMWEPRRLTNPLGFHGLLRDSFTFLPISISNYCILNDFKLIIQSISTLGTIY
jgi:hypothetical protein